MIRWRVSADSAATCVLSTFGSTQWQLPNLTPSPHCCPAWKCGIMIAGTWPPQNSSPSLATLQSSPQRNLRYWAQCQGPTPQCRTGCYWRKGITSMAPKRVPLGILVFLAVLLPSWLAPDAQDIGTFTAEDSPGAAMAITQPGLRQGPELWVSSPPVPTGHDRHRPAVSHDYVHGAFLVVWQNDWPGHNDIYARRVTESGKLLSWFAVTHPTPGLPGNRHATRRGLWRFRCRMAGDLGPRR